MEKHLTSGQIVGYHEQKLLLKELHMINEHIAECTDCREQLCEVEKIDDGVQTFIDELEIEGIEESQHFSYEQLEAYVNGDLDKVDRIVADSHLYICSMCAREVQEVLTFKEELK